MKTPLEIAADMRPTHPHVTDLICRLVGRIEDLETSPHPDGHIDRDGLGNARFVPPAKGQSND